MATTNFTNGISKLNLRLFSQLPAGTQPNVENDVMRGTEKGENRGKYPRFASDLGGRAALMWVTFSFKDTTPDAGMTNWPKRNFACFVPELNKPSASLLT